jgi:hypothetical protein
MGSQGCSDGGGVNPMAVKTGYADAPLHYGRVPQWLAERMELLGSAIVEVLVEEFGREEILRRLSDPCWFQALGCVMGMDWHSSGVTTAVMGALKRGINRMTGELGIHICGGRGKHSRRTPDELLLISDKFGIDAEPLIRASRLSARVDNNAIQDGFQIYLHSFVVTSCGKWAVIQQGMNTAKRMARRYHWHSSTVRSFVESPHSAIVGENQGTIMNLTDPGASSSREAVTQMSNQNPDRVIKEIRHIVLPQRHDVRIQDIDLDRLRKVLTVSHEQGTLDFASVLLVKGLGPKTLRSLALVGEIIYGAPFRFTDPARFSFAHGGKDGHPYPISRDDYDRTIHVLRTAIEHAKVGKSEKLEALQRLEIHTAL